MKAGDFELAEAPGAWEPILVQEATLAYAGLRVRWRAAREGVRLQIPRDNLPYIVDDDGAVDHEVLCDLGAVTQLEAPVAFSVRDPDGDAWEIRQAADGTEEIAYLTPRTEVPWLALRTEPEFRRTRFQYCPSSGPAGVVPIAHPTEQYLVGRLLGRRGDVLLHACALLDEEGVYVFFGHSGAGKSTMSGLGREAGARILADDRTLLRVEDGRVLAAGTPWQGSYRPGIPSFAPVRGIFLLVQAPEDGVVPIPPARAFAELHVRTVQPSHVPSEIEGVVRTLERIVQTVPVSELRFRPTPEAFRTARRAVVPAEVPVAAGAVANVVAETGRPR